ncbi:aspartate aminotransferase family protein [Streptomyces sp. NBC_00285]|uniref:aspartate aminotransferase family protein n=1 Tax=Streptomyces sp. NBC_00285 TaxID=2975700 RepID=UPI002E2A3C4C|nr:aspartate aminotransferase family protein [Streptomyces sp. NBC_00285]
MGFVERYGAAFGRSKALLLRMSGLLAGEQEAQGAWITDTTGRRWLDLGSFGVHLVGHRHPEVVAAARDQLDLMGLSGKVLGNAEATRCAEALIGIAPAGLDQVAFANSGAEAVEMAMKMAALSTGRTEFAALRGSYHGKTAGALHLSDTYAVRSPLPLAAKVHFLDPEDLDQARQVLAGGTVAALFAEPVRGEGGVLPIDPDRLAALRALCQETGTLFALDEIQTGLGRCGTLWRSASDCPPDLLLAGKVLGGGLVPMAAVMYSGTRIGGAAGDPVVLASSFAGGALAGRVGCAVVDVVRQDGFLDEVRRLGESARKRLGELLRDDPRIREVRGEGLMIGVDTASPGVAGQLVLEAAKHGVLLSFCLSNPRVLRVYPPAVIGQDDLDEGLDAIAAAVTAVPETLAVPADREAAPCP